MRHFRLLLSPWAKGWLLRVVVLGHHDPAKGAHGCRAGSLQGCPGAVDRCEQIAMELNTQMESEGAGSTDRRSGMELRHGLPVLGDHQHLAAGGHLVHQPKAAGLELGGVDCGSHGRQDILD